MSLRRVWPVQVLIGKLGPQRVHAREDLAAGRVDQELDLETILEPEDLGHGRGITHGCLEPGQVCIFVVADDERVVAPEVDRGRLYRSASPAP